MKEESKTMRYAEWLKDVPSEITNDPIWKLEVYRLGLFAGDIGWQDVQFLAKKPLMLSVADQLHRSIDSISVNLTEAIPEAKDQTALASSNHHLALRVKAVNGITNLDMFYLLKSLNTA